MQQEIWKDVEGWEGQYQVSNFGNIRSLDKSVKTWYGSRVCKGKILLPFKSKWGYLIATFSNKQKHQKYSVHQLVAKAFIPNPQNKPDVNHINGIKTDNRLENLEWATKQENIGHSWNTGLITIDQMPYGQSHHNSKLTEQDVREIRASAEKKTELAKRFNVTTSTIYYIRTCRSWSRFT